MGKELHHAATVLAKLTLSSLQVALSNHTPRIHPQAIVEAFPSLFLGVMCDVGTYPPRTRRRMLWTHALYPIVLGRLQDFMYAGFCGTGLPEQTRAVLMEELRATRRKTCPFRTAPDLRDDFRELPDAPPQWVRPTLVVEVEYRQRLKDGLRHAALKGIRPDKRPRLIRRSLLGERGPLSLIFRLLSWDKTVLPLWL